MPTHQPTPHSTNTSAATSPHAVTWLGHLHADVVRLSGQDCLDLLHRLSTADLRPLKSQGGVASTVFTTHQGKMLDWVQVIASADQSHVLLRTSPGRGQDVIAWIERYTVMEDVQCANDTAAWEHVFLQGPHASRAIHDASAHAPADLASDPIIVKSYDLPDHATRIECMLPKQQAAAHMQRWANAQPPLCHADAQQSDILRLTVGIPNATHEFNEPINPLELRLGGHGISWNKGCYIGQEVISRLDSYDKLARILIGFDVPDAVPHACMPYSAKIMLHTHQTVGRVTSWNTDPRSTKSYGLAIIKRDTPIPFDAQLVFDNGDTFPATLVDRPFWQQGAPATHNAPAASQSKSSSMTALRRTKTTTALALIAGWTASYMLSGCATTLTPPSAHAAPARPVQHVSAPSHQQNETDAIYAATPPDPEIPVHPNRVVIHDATIMTAAGPIFSPGFLVIDQGRIAAVGSGTAPTTFDHATHVRADGKFVTPGIIDTHSHIGVYPLPVVTAHDDGNEASSPVTAEVWAEHAFWPQDPSISRARAGGITTIQVLPGSANLIGGRSFTAKLRPANSARQMRFVGAPQGLKMACGENPKRTHGDRSGPQTRMGNVAGYRQAFQRAVEYRQQQQRFQQELDAWHKAHPSKSSAETPPSPPTRDFTMETLAAVLDGTMLVHNHCYRADEMHIMLDLAQEFGFKIRSFHHALEAYKLRDRLARENVSVSTWSDWWGFKMEAFDGIPYNAAMLTQAGARTIIHSDSETEIRHLNQEAAKAQTSGSKLGITVTDNDALRWITANPAWALGIESQVGTLEVGKIADVVIWDQHPFSTYARAQQVFIDGALVFDRNNMTDGYRSDFEAGLLPDASSAESTPISVQGAPAR